MIQWYNLVLSAATVGGVAVALTWPGPTTPASGQEPTPTPRPLPGVFAPDLTILFPGPGPTAPATTNTPRSSTPPGSAPPAPTRTAQPRTPTTIAAPPSAQPPVAVPPPSPEDDPLLDIQILIELGLI